MKSIIIIIITLLITLSGCSQLDCNQQKNQFDDYVSKSNLPIIENPDSLCYGLNMGSNFGNLEPKPAIAKLVGFTDYGFTFKGNTKELNISLPFDKEDFGINNHYEIDMNNYCRYIFMMLDSRYPSPLENTFVKPKRISCKN